MACKLSKKVNIERVEMDSRGEQSLPARKCLIGATVKKGGVIDKQPK